MLRSFHPRPLKWMNDFLFFTRFEEHEEHHHQQQLKSCERRRHDTKLETLVARQSSTCPHKLDNKRMYSLPFLPPPP
ncbi:unnamed protein product [Nippostrongylus brasiliensis]|uniref:Secreted protein n=1 Tax=Nippostrongylus brasiliensis TaxID=27835 RepID=A0A0N4Y5B4_NIPBR|nr:unnamed protein product [Nippostrongylus brasiliensis]